MTTLFLTLGLALLLASVLADPAGAAGPPDCIRPMGTSTLLFPAKGITITKVQPGVTGIVVKMEGATLPTVFEGAPFVSQVITYPDPYLSRWFLGVKGGPGHISCPVEFVRND